MKKIYIKSSLIFLFLLALAACQKNTKSITVGEEVEVTTETIGPEGGTITVGKPGDPLDGLKIEVPAGSYQKDTSFEISYRPVIRHTFGEHFNPITPLITVNNGGEYAEEIMTVTIPVSIQDGYFAMAFNYDENTGELDGLPLLDETETSLTVLTKHFSDIIVTIIADELLYYEFTTSFEHGVDDWQFANYGSWVAPDGHCAGQSIAAMYYYTEKKLKKKKPPLYGLYDNDGSTEYKTPELQWDDERAYKLCSMVQKKLDWESEARQYWHKKQYEKPTYTFFCLAYSLLLTEKPQYCSICGKEKEGTADEKQVCHAMIIYKKSGEQNSAEGKKVVTFSVSDPNFMYKSEQEKNERRIEFYTEDGKFKPYASGKTAAYLGQLYPEIFYYPLKAFTDKRTLDSLWKDFEDKTIGNDYFPDYSLLVVDGSTEMTLASGHKTTSNSITIKLCSTDFLFDQRLRIYSEKGNELGTYNLANITDDCLTATIKDLKPGGNLLGFHVEGAFYNTENGIQTTTWEYAGFDWINIIYEQGGTNNFSHLKTGYIDIGLVTSTCQNSDGSVNEELYNGIRWDAKGSFSGNTFTGTLDKIGDSRYGGGNGIVKIAMEAVLDVDSANNVTGVKSFYAEGTLTSPPNPPFDGSENTWKIRGQNVPVLFEGSSLEFRIEDEKTCESISLFEYTYKTIDAIDNSVTISSQCAGDKCEPGSRLYLSFAPE